MTTDAAPAATTPASDTQAGTAARPAVLVVVADTTTTTMTAARLDREARERLRRVLDEADLADAEEAVLRLVRQIVVEGCPDRPAIGVRFATTLHSNGHYPADNGDVLFSDGTTDMLHFGDEVGDLLATIAGPQHASYGVAVDLRHGSVFGGDSVGDQPLTEVFAPDPTPPHTPDGDTGSSTNADPDGEAERLAGVVLTAVRDARVAAEMGLVALVARRSWPQAVSLRLVYTLAEGPDPVIDNVRLAEVHGPDGALWKRSEHVRSATADEVVSPQRLARLDSHLFGAMPDARSFGHGLRWIEHGDGTVTAPLPPL